MKEWRKKVRRILVLLLTAALIGNTVDFPVFAVSAAENRETGLCRHHQSHTVECGCSEEDNLPCEYECRICPMEDLIAALPDEVTEDNGSKVRAQLNKILALYRELTEEEQDQIDLTLCYELQAALDEANVPLEVTSMPQKAKNSEGTMLEVGSDFIYEIDGTTYNCIVVSSTSNEAAVVWKEMQNPESDLLESKQSMILSCEEKGGRLIKYAEYQVLSDYQIISLNSNFNTFGCQEYAACYCNSGYWEGDKTYSWTDWSYFIAFDLRCNSIKPTENFNSEKYYDGTPFEVDTNSFTWKGTATPTIKFYSDMNGTEISAPSAVGTYYIKLSIADPVVEDGIRYEAAESDYIEITILPIITEQPESAELYYGYVAGNVLSVTVATDGVTYQWYENNSTIDGATQATYTVPAGKMVGTYQYYCKVSLGDYTEQSQIANVTVVKSGSTLESRLTVLNGETETNRFTASDTITVIATPTATGAAPAAMMVASLDAPTGGQMALFVGDTQVSEPASAGADGTYTMTASASDVLTLGQVKPNGAPITLTAKFVGNGNMADAAATVEVNISALVKVEIGNATTYYGDIRTAWTAAKGNTATVTLLADVPESMSLFVTEGDDITFDGGKFTLTGPPNNNRIFDISGGKLTVTGGTLKTGENTSVPQSFDIIISGGELVVTGGSLEAGMGYVGLSVVGNAPVKLSGGTFHGIGMSTLTDNVGRLLLNYGSTNAAEKHYAYYQGDEPVDLTKLERQYVLTDTVTVAECKHTGVIPTLNDDGTHTLKCPYCGYTGTAENCSYGTEYQHDDAYHWLTCTVCGYENKEAHNWEFDSAQNGNVIENYWSCFDCGRTKDHLTLTITVPDGLTYGNTEGKQVTYTVSPETTCDKVRWRFTGGDWPEFADGVLPAGLSVGDHWFRVEGLMSDDTIVFSGSYYLTVSPASLTDNMVELQESVTYSGAAQEPAVTVKQGETTLAEGTDYDVTYSTTDFTNAGTVIVTIKGKGNYTGTVEKTYTIKKAPLTITASDQTITYGGSITQGTGDVTAAGLCSGDRLDGITLTASTANVPGGNITPSAAGIKNSGGKDVTGNYEITYKDGRLTINKAGAEITVGTGTYNKTYGDATFTLDVTDNNTEADVQYEVTAGADVISVSNGTVTIKNAGTATITVSLPETANYNAAASRTITVNVAQKGGYTVAEQNRSYLYSRENTGSIDLAALLPKDCGAVTYGTPAASGDVTYSVAPAVNDGKLSYTLNSGNINDEGTITITVATQNYTDITITVKVKLTDQIPVSLKTGTEVTLKDNVLTYGETLSKLIFNEAEFVGDDGNTVAGTLAWKDAAATPNAGTASAVWVFTPADTAYVEVEGTAAITVNKAAPTVSETPAVADRVYNPSRVLEQGDLSGITVTGMDGNTLKGEWNWKDSNIVPTVNNSGYVAVFTPTDATNYETVTSTVTVNVTKATPYIAELPAAARITYGDTLNVSALSGGTVQYGNGTGQAGSGAGSTETVAGIFTWKESSTRPAVADSGKTEYTVVFTPSDTINYETTECSVTLTVQKAGNAPNMPGSTMDVPNSCERVSDVTLPENWEWKASDQDTVLEAGKAVNAVAVYTGADKGSYEKETVTITITRASCDHVAGEILYTGEGEKAPACGSDGLGHRECTKCGYVTETGIVIPALEHDYTDKVTKEPTTESEGIRTYTCSLCGNQYTESIPKLPEETHQHSYTESVTKEPTCTDTGIRTYTCSCGDSYTETIAALGHNYLGRETKKPTTTAEGVMTYTCDHCGDTYTQSIPKLPGTASGNTSNQENKIPVKGEVISDAKSKAVYTVTQAGKTGGTVSYTKSADNKATSISVPNTVIVNGISYKVTSVAQNAFKNNKKLTKVTIGNNITAIGSNAFYGCKKLKNVSMGTNVTTIGTKSFYKCTNLTKITIPAKVSRIGKQAFYGCKKLKTITIKTKKLTSKKVGSKAFKGIHSKATVKVPKSKLKIYKQMLKAKGIGSKVKVKK
ncbi:MAG: leucine-rich repeat protein [Lachnospiraceae bacterium]|nr:leucine-rich repeat protein [Lachnospiraceae bacterium]